MAIAPRGCYAMTDEQIAEIYSLGRRSFFGGQRAFQLQAFPFKDDADQHGEASQQSEHAVLEDDQRLRSFRGDAAGRRSISAREIRLRCDPRAERQRNDPVFNASAKCPIRSRRRRSPMPCAKQQQEQAETNKADLARHAGGAHMNTGIDGGMNKGVRRKAA